MTKKSKDICFKTNDNNNFGLGAGLMNRSQVGSMTGCRIWGKYKFDLYLYGQYVSVADPDPGSSAFVTPEFGIRNGKNLDPG